MSNAVDLDPFGDIPDPTPTPDPALDAGHAPASGPAGGLAAGVTRGAPGPAGPVGTHRGSDSPYPRSVLDRYKDRARELGVVPPQPAPPR